MLARYARCALPMPPDQRPRGSAARGLSALALGLPLIWGLTVLLGFGSILHLPAIEWSMGLIVVAWTMTYVRAFGRHSA